MKHPLSPLPIALTFILLLLCATLLTIAPSDALNVRQKYEEQLIQWALKRAGLKREPNPTGKVITRVVIVRENIIAKSDPWPTFLNIIHFKTRDHVIRQELLLKPGQTWKQARINESARNLRAIPILAVVRLVPCKSKDPSGVILLVVTKDLWSLRMNSYYNQSGLVLKLLEWFPTEMNFLGYGKRVGLHVRLSQLDLDGFHVRDHFALGQYYFDRRFFGSRVQLYQRLDLYINGNVPCAGAFRNKTQVWCPQQKPGSLNGAYAQLSITRPLFSLATRWAFSVDASLSIRQARIYKQNTPGNPIPLGEQAGLSLRTLNFQHPDGLTTAIPHVYDSNYYYIGASLTRSFGKTLKHDFTVGLGAYLQRYAPPTNFPFDDFARIWFKKNVLARDESALYLYASAVVRGTKFRRLRNIQGFALSEDFRLGPTLTAQLRLAREILHPSQYFIEGGLSASYLWEFFENLLSASVSGFIRYQPLLADLGFPAPWANGLFRASLRNISPLLWIGRIHLYGVFQMRYNDLDNNFSFLGSDSGLRGYPSDQFFGKNLLRFNAEFRSLPLNLWTLHVGFTIFYDGGGVFGGLDPSNSQKTLPFVYRHSVGIGIRGQFPQFDKGVLRIDMGIPLSSDAGPFASWISISFGQLF